MLNPGRKNLTIIRGEDFFETFRMRYQNADGSPGDLLSLVGWSAVATLFLPDGTTLPFTVTLDAAQSTVKIYMEDTVTLGLPEQNCSWRLRMINPGGEKIPWLIGRTEQSEGAMLHG